MEYAPLISIFRFGLCEIDVQFHWICWAQPMALDKPDAKKSIGYLGSQATTLRTGSNATRLLSATTPSSPPSPEGWLALLSGT